MKKGKIELDKKKIIFKRSKSSYIKEACKTDSNSSTFYSNNANIYPYSYTHINPRLFLDYTFKGNKSKIYNNDNNYIYINKLKAQNYQYELEQTFNLNIDLLSKYYNNNNKNNNDKNKEIILLLNSIKNKEKIKKELKISIKQKCNELISKNDCINFLKKKLNNQIDQYNIKLENKIKEIYHTNNYISELKQRFSVVEKYINKIRFNSEGRKGLNKKNKLTKFINSNNKHLLKISNYIKEIKKLKSNISELKKDNKLIRSQKKLYKVDKPDINLIRVVEFYIRIIKNISSKNKILKNSINSLSKTLEILDLDQIANFNEYKRSRQKSSYEINFSDLDEDNYHKNKRDDINIQIFQNYIDFNEIFN